MLKMNKKNPTTYIYVSSNRFGSLGTDPSLNRTGLSPFPQLVPKPNFSFF